MSIHGMAPKRDRANEFPATLGFRGMLATVEVDPLHEKLFEQWMDSVQASFAMPEAVIEESRSRTWGAKHYPKGTRCAYCLTATDSPARDHIVPFSDGGDESYDNIVPACKQCNSRKHAMSLLQFVAAGGIS